MRDSLESMMWKGPRGQHQEMDVERHGGQGERGPEGRPKEFGLDPVHGGDCSSVSLFYCAGVWRGSMQIYPTDAGHLPEGCPLPTREPRSHGAREDI